MRVFTQTTTTTDTRSSNANTSTQSNICEFVNKLSITMILILENNKNKTTRIECLTAKGPEKRK